MYTYTPACVDVGYEYGYVSSFAVSRHEYSQGCTYQDSGKSSHNQSEAGALGTASPPGSQPWGAQNQHPHRGKQGLWAAPFSAAPCRGQQPPHQAALGCSCLLCLSISSGCRHGEFLFLFLFSYQRQLTSRRNQARVSYKINLIWRLFFIEKYQRISTLLLFKSRTISSANSSKKKMSSTLYSMKLFIKGKALYRCEEFFSSRNTAHPTSAGEGLTSKRGKRGREENLRWWSWEFIQDENFFKEEKSAPPTTSLCSWTALTFKALEVKF